MAKQENVRMKALYDYQARTPNELSFKKGSSVFVFSTDDDGWASGECHGLQGWFPSSYVTPDTALTEMAHAQAEVDAGGGTQNKNVDRRSLLMQKQQTSTHLNEALAKRPDREQLEQQHILTPSTSTSASVSAAVAKPAASGGVIAAPSAAKREDPKKKGIGGIFGFGKKKDATPLATSNPQTTFLTASTPPPTGAGGGLSSSAGATASAAPAATGSAPQNRPARYFRVALHQLPDMKDGSRQLPSIVDSCVEYIRRTALDLEGIFRISGLASEVDGLQKQFESGDYSGKLRSNDPHAVAGVLKKFFRELPEPLFTIENHKPFLDTLKIDQASQAAALKPLVDALPAVNLRIIRYMIPFLFLVSRHKERNMMSIQNLSIVFGPTFMRSAEENRTGVPDGTNRGAAVIENLILHCEAIFGSVEGADTTTASRPPAPEARRGTNPAGPNTTPLLPAPAATTAPSTKTGGSTRGPISPRPAGGEQGDAQHARSASSSNPPTPAGSRIQPTPPGGVKPPGGSVITPPPAGIKPPSRAPAKAAAAPAQAAAPPPAATPQKTVRALYDYKGDPAKGQLSFAGGEIINLISQHESGWWTGEIRGHKGYFPSTFVEAV